MKQIVSLLLALVLLLALAGCGGKAPEKPDDVRSPTAAPGESTPEPTKPPEPTATPPEPTGAKGPAKSLERQDAEGGRPPSLARQLTGVYRNNDPQEGDEHRIEIFAVGGTLLIENRLLMDDSVYSFWVQELRPEDGEALSGNVNDAVSGRELAFSVMSGAGRYWQPITDIAVALTADGVCITRWEEGERRETAFERVEGAERFHDMAAEQYAALDLGSAMPLGEPLVGEWCYTDGDSAVWLSLQADGSFLGALKMRAQPIRVNLGAWGIDSSGNLTVVAQRPDTGTMPYQWTLEWEQTPDAGVALAVLASCGDALLPGAGRCILRPASADWRIPDALYEEAARELVYEDMRSGSFYAPAIDDDVSYAYSMQLLPEELPGALEFNLDMNQRIGKTIWAQWYAMDNGGIPEYTEISCRAYEYEGLYSFVYTLTRWIDNRNEYEIYFFDKHGGTGLHADEVLEKLGLDRFRHFLPACVEAGQAKLVDTYADTLLPREELEALLDRTRQYVGLLTVEPYVTGDGTLCAAIPVASIVGADYYYELLPLSLCGS